MDSIKIYEFEGLNNVRDLGGYKTASGHKVKYGLLIRGVSNANISLENDIKLFKSLNLKTMIDFRSKNEAKDRPDIKMPGVNYYLMPAMCLENGEEIVFSSAGINRLFKYVKKNNIVFREKDWYFHYYRLMFYNKNVYGEMFKMLLNNEVPMYLHCSAGKDRTGVASILILLTLGVSREDAIKDYLLSNECYKKEIEEKINEKQEDIKRYPYLKKEIMLTYGVDSSYVEKELDEIYQKYGSFEKFLIEFYELKYDDILKLRAMYTENNI